MASESVETNATDQTTPATPAVGLALETTQPEVTEKANESSKKKKKPISKLKVINDLQYILCLSDGILTVLNFCDLEVFQIVSTY